MLDFALYKKTSQVFLLCYQVFIRTSHTKPGHSSEFYLHPNYI